MTAAIAITAAVLLFLRRPRDPVAALFSIGLLGQAASASSAVATWSAFGVLHVGAVLFSGSIGAFTLGVLLFPNGRIESCWSKWLPIPVIAWTLVHWADFQTRVLTAMTKDLGTLALFFLCLTTLVVRFRRLEAGQERQQVRWALFGFVMTSLLFLAQRATLAESSNEIVLIWSSLAAVTLTAMVTLFIAVGLLISLLHYRLYDAEAAISRSAGVAILTLLLGAVFAASAKLIEIFFETALGRDGGALPGAIGAGLAVVLFTPAHHRIQNWAERRFQKAMLRLRNRLPEVVGDLRETAKMAELRDRSGPPNRWPRPRNGRAWLPKRSLMQRRWRRTLPPCAAVTARRSAKSGRRTSKLSHGGCTVIFSMFSG